jgi:hypothetical protein
LLVTANVVPISPIRVTLMMEALRFSETSVLTIGTRRNIPEESILELNFLRRVLRLLVTVNVVPVSQILVTLMIEAIRSFDTSVLTRATRRHIQED